MKKEYKTSTEKSIMYDRIMQFDGNKKAIEA